MPINPSLPFKPIRIAILTVSDTRALNTDKSGDTLAERIQTHGHILADRTISPDDIDEVIAQLAAWSADDQIDCIITTGGTGVTGRDITPEAVEAVCQKMIPGFGELFRWISFAKIGSSTIQSRATAGISNGTYIFALPGSPSAVKDAWDEILQHQLDSRFRPCNFIDLMPRLKE